MSNELTKSAPSGFKSGLQKVTETYTNSVVTSLKNVGIATDARQTQCITLAIQKMNDVLKQNGTDFNSINPSSITQALTQIAMLKINITSIPSEGYIVLRGKDVQFGIQGAGYRKLVDVFGRNVKRTLEPWVIREHDKFTYPHFKGLEVEAPEWMSQGYGKALRVVCPIEMNDGKIQWIISEREQVKENLLAHISNNLLKDRPTWEKVYAKAENMTLDEILADKEILTLGKVSPAWKGANRESMIITKMENNAYKPFPKDSDSVIMGQIVQESEEAEEEAHPSVTIDLTADKDTETEIKEDLGSKKMPDVSDFEEKPKATEKPKPKNESSDDDLPF